ncbi:MAG: TIGR03915 family putative DNA repair protein [Daejeonella sp.]
MGYAAVIYDGTWLGFLTAVFEVYERKLDLVHIYKQEHFQPGVFGDQLPIHTDEQKAKRVWKGLESKLSAAALKSLFSCYLSELDGIEDTLLAYVRLAFSSDQSIEQAYADPAVLRVVQVNRMVHREKHRMEAFIRFQLTRDNIFYAAIEPDFNVIPLISAHFKRRYADQKWIIYDLKRKYGIYYDLERVEEVTFTFTPDTNVCDTNTIYFKEDEALYQVLWKDYFKHVNIVSRKNTRLHVQHVPKRYWKYLTEKY